MKGTRLQDGLQRSRRHRLRHGLRHRLRHGLRHWLQHRLRHRRTHGLQHRSWSFVRSQMAYKVEAVPVLCTKPFAIKAKAKAGKTLWCANTWEGAHMFWVLRVTSVTDLNFRYNCVSMQFQWKAMSRLLRGARWNKRSSFNHGSESELLRSKGSTTR